MSKNRVFLISDTHFGHRNILKFKRDDGSPVREFDDLNHMHRTIINNWNSVVRPQDKVYHLGDVAFQISCMQLFDFLNGKKRLIRGNHDLFQLGVYTKYFEEIYGVRQINGVWLTHVPMHEDSVNAQRVKCNAHGHLHWRKINHSKYFNCSVECINYTPIDIEEVIELTKA